MALAGNKKELFASVERNRKWMAWLHCFRLALTYRVHKTKPRPYKRPQMTAAAHHKISREMIP
jgi:hypothetical protein